MLAILSRIRTARMRQSLMRLALGGFLVRALIPIGFMPASMAQGGPIIICHGGLAGTFFQQLAEEGHDAHLHGGMADHSAAEHDEPSPDHDAWEHCPTGVTASAAALATDFSFSLLALTHAQSSRDPCPGIPAAPVTSYQARAPPLNLAQSL
jgi:hypothetical protein